MTSDTPQAETAPTRRSSRRQAAPAVSSGDPEETAQPTDRRARAESTRPATVWAAPHPSVDEATDAASAEVAPAVSRVAGIAVGTPAPSGLAASADAPTARVPLTRKQARELALRAAAAAAIAAEQPATLTADAALAGTTPVEVALSAIDDAPVSAPEVDVVEVPAAAERAEVAAPAEILVPAMSSDEAAFTEAVLIGDEDAHAIVDEFEAAARLFAFTGETPIQVAAAAIVDDTAVPEADAQAAAEPRRRRFSGASFKRASAASASIGAMGIVGLLAIGMTTPAEAVAAGNASASVSLAAGSQAGSSFAEDEIQAYVAPADAQSATLDRSDYSTASTAQIAAESGISSYSNFFTNNVNSAIQWPFAVGVSISYGFGMRSGTMHEGLDFTPGSGAQIQAVADGTVRIATESGGGYGVMVIIDHVIDGALVSTRYGHMQYGSLKVKTGDTVKVGQIIGLVGDTGYSFGAHLHFEVLQNGTTAIDPLPWLRSHAGG